MQFCNLQSFNDKYNNILNNELLELWNFSKFKITNFQQFDSENIDEQYEKTEIDKNVNTQNKKLININDNTKK